MKWLLVPWWGEQYRIQFSQHVAILYAVFVLGRKMQEPAEDEKDHPQVS